MSCECSSKSETPSETIGGDGSDMPVPGMLYSATFDDTAETERDVDLGGSQADESRTSARRLTATVPARRHVMSALILLIPRRGSPLDLISSNLGAPLCI